jgi:hypothetical protein
MNVQVEDFVRVLQLPSGRTCFSARTLLIAARKLLESFAEQAEGNVDELEKRQVTSIVDESEKLLQLGAVCGDIELRYRKPVKKPIHGEKAGKADGALDRAWTDFVALCQSVVNLLGTDNPKGAAAHQIVDKGFPRGVAAITNKSFVEEFEASMALIERLTKGDLRDAVNTVGFGVFVERLGVLAEQLGSELGKPEPDTTPTWDEVRAARAAMHDQLARVIAIICGAFAQNTDAHNARRSELLGPIATQQQRLRARYRARLGVLDVDPETGEETPDPVPADDPPSA